MATSDQGGFTERDVADARPPWTRIIDVSKPAEEHEIGIWGCPLWLAPGDLIGAKGTRWWVLRSRLELPTLGSGTARRAVLHIEVETSLD